MFKRYICLASLVLLAACAQTTTNPDGTTTTVDPLAKIATFTIADLQNADAEAVAANDVVAHACYPALIKFVTELQAQNASSTGQPLTVSGAFSAFQKARNVRRSVAAGGGFSVPDYLKLGCAPLVLDEQQLLIRLGLIGAGSLIPGASVLQPIISGGGGLGG